MLIIAVCLKEVVMKHNKKNIQFPLISSVEQFKLHFYVSNSSVFQGVSFFNFQLNTKAYFFYIAVYIQVQFVAFYRLYY